MSSSELSTKGKYDLGDSDAMAKMGTVLKSYVVKQKLFTNIQGKNYAHVEGWQFAGGLLGLFPRVVSVENLSSSTEVKWMVKVDIINLKTDAVVSTGFAVCSSKESKKRSFDEYAILSMAQTRAIGKAYRNMIGWVMKLAGYEGTPSEEMHKVGETHMDSSDPTIHSTADALDYACSKKGCGNEITKAEHDFSVKLFKKPLCREHQKEAKNR